MTAIQVICLIAVLCYLLLLVLVRRDIWRKEVRSFALFLASMLAWQAGVTGATFSTTPETALFWYKLFVGLGSSFGLFYAQFTRDFLGIRTHGWVMKLGYPLGAAIALWVISGGPFVFEGMYWSEQSGYYVPEFGIFFLPMGLFVYGYLTYSLVHQLRAYHTEPSQLVWNRLKYLILGVSLVFLASLGNYLPALRKYPIDILANVANAFLVAYAIFRYQLFDIAIVVRRGVLYSIPTAIVGAAYFLIVYLAVNLFHVVLGYQVVLVSLLLAAITAVAVQPLWSRMQAWLDRIFFRETYDASLMIERLSRTTASVLDLDDLAHMILGEIADTMQVGRVGLLLKHEERGDFRLAAERALTPIGSLKLTDDHPLVTWLSIRGSGLTRAEMDVLPHFKALWIQEREDLDRLDAELFVPLLVRDNLIGILVLGPKLSQAPYSQDEQRVLATLANQTAVAIQNAWLFSLEQRKAKESVALLDIARAVSSTLNLTQMLEVIAQRTAEVCGVDRCSILLLDTDGERLLPLMSQFGDGGRDKELWELFRQRTYTERVDSVPVISNALERREPVVVDSGLLEDLPRSWIEPFGIRSLLAVPLVAKDQAIGLMALDHTQADQGFAEEQISLAATIGTQVSIAIENARLYEETIEEKERTETIVEQAFAGIMLIDPEGHIMTINPEVEAITGYTSQELIGRQLSELFGPEVWGRESILSQVRETGDRVITAEAKLEGRNGTRDILLGVIPIREGFLLNFTDISRLKEVDRLKTSIVANVSHELRAPLASIKAYTELLLDNLEGEDKVLRHRFLSIIDQEADWLTELINDLLDLSRLESEQYAAHMEPLSLTEVIDGAMTLLDHQIRRVEVDVNLDLPADLPLIVGDKELLTILVKNLVSNAAKFSAPGGSVGLTVRHDPEHLVLCVVDQGMGIPNEDLPNLFTKFYRTSVSREAGVRGTGLGLVLVKEAVDLHDGIIELESELGVGTRVRVTLPTKYQDIVEANPERERAYG